MTGHEIFPITAADIPECVSVIRRSFLTVAKEFGFTEQNAPRFTAFATTEERLLWQLEAEHRHMFACRHGTKIIGYYSLLMQEDGTCELSNLCVLPEARHHSIGAELLLHATGTARNSGCTKMTLGIVEENARLRLWYEAHGFVHTGTQKFDFFPFTCGYMEKRLRTECV